MEPRQINKKEFATVRLREGYNPEEVDAFLDEIEVAWTKDRSALAAVQEELRRMRFMSEAHTPPEGFPALQETSPGPVSLPVPPQQGGGPSMESMAKLLDVAQRTADEMVLEAQSKSTEMLREARIKSVSVTRDAEGRVAELEAKVSELTIKESDYRAFLKNALDSFGTALGKES